MKSDKKYYYKVYLEVALKTAEHVFGFINISHIPYRKFEELFKDQVREERYLFDDSMSYFIKKELYDKHKLFLDNEIPFSFDFDLFEYSVSFSGDVMEKYKKDYYEELPPLLIENQ